MMNDSEDGQQNDQMQQFFGPFFGQRMMPQQPRVEHGIGSGVIISPDGYIVTNNHVVDSSTGHSSDAWRSSNFAGKVNWVDPLTDLAVIKVNATNLPSVPWGDSTELRPGETVLALAILLDSDLRSLAEL